jgi:trimeric autotransporter adhesin
MAQQSTSCAGQPMLAALSLAACLTSLGAASTAYAQVPAKQFVNSHLRTTLSGSVEYPNGVPAAGVSVQLSTGQVLETDAAGRFEGQISVAETSVVLQLKIDQELNGVPYAAAGQSGPLVANGLTRAGRLVLAAQTTIDPGYVATFGSLAGANGSVFAFGAFDFGFGAELVAGGAFTNLAGVACQRVMRYDGQTVRAIGAGLPAAVRSLSAFDAGQGLELYAGGDFEWSLGSPLAGVARFDGQSWVSAIDFVQYLVFGTVRDLLVADLGAGPRLYAGGSFTFHDVPINLAVFDGLTWSAVGGGIHGSGTGVHAMELFDGDGDGQEELYVGGQFSLAGAVGVANLARWDGNQWSSVGSGANATVRALEAADLGSGERLFVAGDFTLINALTVSRVAGYDGISFFGLGAGLNGPVNVLEVVDLPSAGPTQGPVLVAGGQFQASGSTAVSRLGSFDGQAWSALVGPLNGPVYALAAVPGGATPLAFAGAFTTIAGPVASGGLSSPNIALYGSGGAQGVGRAGLAYTVNALLEHDLGSGPELFLGGDFESAGSKTLAHVARFDGMEYAPVGSGFTGEVLCLTVFDSGNGPELVAGGDFIEGGNQNLRRTARFDGVEWQPLVFVNGPVNVLLPVSDGSGTRLYIGGDFTNAGGVTALSLAVWEAGQVSAVGAGVSGSIAALSMFQAAGQPKPQLYVGGGFIGSGSLPNASGVLRLEGDQLVDLGLMPFSGCSALQVFDDGQGPALFVGGTLRLTPLTPSSDISFGVMRFDGASFTPLPFLTKNVNALALHDDGSGQGPELYVGGSFSVGAGQFLNGIARWDGQAYGPLVPAQASVPTLIRALASVRLNGVGPRSLVLGGNFQASPAGDAHAARFGPPGF